MIILKFFKIVIVFSSLALFCCEKLSDHEIQEYNKKVQNCIIKNHFEEAIVLSNKMEKIDRSFLTANFYKGIAYYELFNYENAEREFTKIIEENIELDFYLPREMVHTYAWRGQSRLMLGKFDLAMEDADKCIKYYQDDKKGYLLKLFIYINSEDYAKALSFVEIIKAQFPNWSSPYYYNAIVYYLQRSYIQAIEECNLIKKNEFDIDKKYLYIRGLSYLSIGEYFLALNDLTYIYDNYPERKWVNYSLAYAHYKSGNIEQAKINYQISLNAKTKTKDNPHQVYDEIQSVTESFKAKKDVQNVFKILSEMVKEN